MGYHAGVCMAVLTFEYTLRILVDVVDRSLCGFSVCFFGAGCV